MAAIAFWEGLIRKRRRYGGAGYIAGELPNGIVTAGGLAAAREIEVRHRLTRMVIAVGFSRSDGTYRFDDLDTTQLLDIGVRDWTEEYDDYWTSAYPVPY